MTGATNGLISDASAPFSSSGGGVTSLNALTGALSLTSSGNTILITPSGSSINLEASGGASVGFDALTSGTNTAAAMLVGSGASLGITGTGTIAATSAVIANEGTDTTCFPLFATAATGTLPLKSNAAFTLNSNTGALGATSFSGAGTGLTGTASSLTAGAVTGATFTTALTVNTGTVTLTGNAANTSVLTIGAGAVSVSGANTGDQTITLTGAVTGSGTGSFATTIATPGTLTVSSTNSNATAHTHAITSSSAPGAAASLLATDASGIIGSTGTRIVKGWFVDLTVTNAIVGSVTGNAGTVTTNANLTGVITSSGNATSTGSQTGTGNTFAMSASPTFTGTVTVAAQTTTGISYLNGGVIEETVFSNGNSGTSKAINLDNGNLQSVTITGAVAITQTTPTHPGKYTLIITQDGSGHVYSLSGIKWAGGTTPTYSTAASKVDIFSIIYDGTNYYGMAGIAFS